MSKTKTLINAETLSVADVLTKNFFNVPLYQRPYSWDDEQVEKLWEDLCDFCINDKPHLNPNDAEPIEYFLGPVVIYTSYDKEKRTRNQIIDGQQRLTTLILLLHQLYMKLKDNGDTNLVEEINPLLWRQQKGCQGENIPDFESPALTSEVMSDMEQEEFKRIMKQQKYDEGPVNLYDNAKNDIKGTCSKYKHNNALIYEKIYNAFGDGAEFKEHAKIQVSAFTRVILNYCKLLYVECPNEEAALRIFDTLNNRGMQLRDADIFKARIYDSMKEKKDDFKEKWRKFETLARGYGLGKENEDPLNDMFRQLMHYIRAEHGWTQKEIGLRAFFEQKPSQQSGYDELNENVFDLLHPLAALWQVISGYKRYSEIEEEEYDELENVKK